MMPVDREEQLIAGMPRSQRFPEQHTCPRAVETPLRGLAIWDPGDHCSFCGSLHPDVLMSRIEGATVELGPTDKNYKVYVHAVPYSAHFLQSYRMDGSLGGDDPAKWEWTTRSIPETKFYFSHLSEEQRQRFVELLNAGCLRIGIPGHFYRLPFFVKPS